MRSRSRSRNPQNFVFFSSEVLFFTKSIASLFFLLHVPRPKARAPRGARGSGRTPRPRPVHRTSSRSPRRQPRRGEKIEEKLPAGRRRRRLSLSPPFSLNPDLFSHACFHTKNKTNDQVERPDKSTCMVLLPAKFHKKMWIKRGGFLLARLPPEATASGAKLAGEVERVLYDQEVAELKKMVGVWPREFEEGGGSGEAATAAATTTAGGGGTREGGNGSGSGAAAAAAAAGPGGSSKSDSDSDSGLPPLEENPNRRRQTYATSSSSSDDDEDSESYSEEDEEEK